MEQRFNKGLNNRAENSHLPFRNEIRNHRMEAFEACDVAACLASPEGLELEFPRFYGHFSLMKESVFHAENEEPVPDGIQGTVGCASAGWSQC